MIPNTGKRNLRWELGCMCVFNLIDKFLQPLEGMQSQLYGIMVHFKSCITCIVRQLTSWTCLNLDSRIHPVFHVSLFKEKLGSKVSAQLRLPLHMEDQDELRIRPQAVLDRRTRQNKTQILVHWQGSSATDATWEDLNSVVNQFPQYTLADKGPF